MRDRIIVAVSLLSAVWPLCPAAEASAPTDFEKRVKACTVRVLASAVAIAGDETGGASFGSGFVVDQANGLVVTNYHVVSGSERVFVRLHASTEPLRGTVVAHDSRRDLALLRVADAEKLPPSVALSAKNWDVGQFVVSVGSPGGYDFSASLGIISAVERPLADSRSDVLFIQTDATMYHGSSGGPLANLDGEIIGMNSRGGADGAAAFAIPADVITTFVAEWKEKPALGRTSFGHLGVVLQPLTDDVQALLGAGEEGGAVVTYVYRNSAAARAGLRIGDLLTAVGDVSVAAASEAELELAQSEILGLGPGKQAITLVRAGRRKVVTATLGARPPCSTESLDGGALSVRAHAGERCYLLPPEEFLEVAHAAGAGRNSLRTGDLIVWLAGSRKDLKLRLQKQLAAERPARVLAVVLRQGAPKLLVLSGQQ